MDKETGAGMFGSGIKHSVPIGTYPNVFQAELTTFVQMNLDRNALKD